MNISAIRGAKVPTIVPSDYSVSINWRQKVYMVLWETISAPCPFCLVKTDCFLRVVRLTDGAEVRDLCCAPCKAENPGRADQGAIYASASEVRDELARWGDPAMRKAGVLIANSFLDKNKKSLPGSYLEQTLSNRRLQSIAGSARHHSDVGLPRGVEWHQQPRGTNIHRLNQCESAALHTAPLRDGGHLPRGRSLIRRLWKTVSGIFV